MSLAQPVTLGPCIASGDAPAAGLTRYMVTLTDLDVWEIIIDAPDAIMAERFACRRLNASPGAKSMFRYLDGGIGHVEALELASIGGAA